MVPLEEREQYQSDGGLSWSVFLLGAPLALLVAAGCGWLLKLAFNHGWYILVIAPVFAGFLTAGAVVSVVYLSSCRNRWLASALGLTAGVVCYLGYYYWCFQDFMPPGRLAPLNELPMFIQFRINTDVAVDVARNQNNQPQQPAVVMNWLMFAMEFLLVVGASVGLAWKTASRAYLSEVKAWMSREMLRLPVKSGRGFIDAFQEGLIEDFLVRTSASTDPQNFCQVTLEYAPGKVADTLDHPVYLTIEDIPDKRSWYMLPNMRRPLVRQAVLTPKEVLELRGAFPILAQVLSTSVLDAVEPAESASEAQPEIVTTLARKLAVPEPYRQKVRTKSYIWLVNLFDLVPVFYILIGAGLAYYGVTRMQVDQLSLGIPLLSVGAICIVWGIYTGGYCMSVYSNRWINGRLRAELDHRTDPLFDPRSPEAKFVSLIPRENFTKVVLVFSSDILLAYLDRDRQELLLEGDIDRYRIPVDAIQVWEPQCFFTVVDANRTTQLWMVRLFVTFDTGDRELLLSVGDVSWRPKTNASRKRNAEAFCQELDDLKS